MKKILLLLVSVSIVLSLFIGCTNQNTDAPSSEITSADSSSTVESDKQSSTSSKNDDKESSSKNETSSLQSNESSSSKSNTNNTSTISRPSVSRPGNNSSKVQTSSVSTSEGVKVYENPSNLGLMCYSLYMKYTTAMGTAKENREHYFQEIVNQRYFNQYLIRIDDDLLDNARIIAEAGGSIWIQLTANVRSNPNANYDLVLSDYIKKVENALNTLEEAGYGKIVNGFFYDEPLKGKNITINEFVKATGAIYKKFGLRMFTVFSTYEFTGIESNISVNHDEKAGVVTTYGMKYLTDVGFDAYSTDVREGATNGGKAKFNEWQANCSKDIVDGKTFYTEHRKLLEQKAGHKVNFWHFPCAWTEDLWGGLNALMIADEDYWIAHLDFMANDIVNSSNPGGLCLYTFRRIDADTNEAFERHMDLKNEVGGWAIYDEVPKYENYCKKLRQWCSVFSSKRCRFVTDLDV